METVVPMEREKKYLHTYKNVFTIYAAAACFLYSYLRGKFFSISQLMRNQD